MSEEIKDPKKRHWLYHPEKDYTTSVFFTGFVLILNVIGAYSLVYDNYLGSWIEGEVYLPTRRTNELDTVGGILALLIPVACYLFIRWTKHDSAFVDKQWNIDGKDAFRAMLLSNVVVWVPAIPILIVEFVNRFL